MRQSKEKSAIDNKTLKLMSVLSLAGNIRELQNIIERSVILCNGIPSGSCGLAFKSNDLARIIRPSNKTFRTRKGTHRSGFAESNGKVAGQMRGCQTRNSRSTLDLKIKQLNIKKRTRKSSSSNSQNPGTS